MTWSRCYFGPHCPFCGPLPKRPREEAVREFKTLLDDITRELAMFGKGGKPSKTPAADMQLPSKEELEALAKASGVPVEEIEKDAPKKAAPPPWTADEAEEKTQEGRPPMRSTMEGVCPVCGLVTKEAQCPIDGTVLGK